MIAIILDGQLQSALSVTRSLGERGIKVICGSTDKFGMSLYSKFCNQKFFYTSPRLSKKKYVADIIQLVDSLSEEAAIFCFSDETFLPISKNLELFPKSIKFLVPASKDIEVAFDKEKTLRLAQELSIPIPKTYFVSSLEEVKQLAAIIKYPAVIKPRHSCFWENDKGHFSSVSFVDSASEMAQKYKEMMEKMKEAPIIQEYIVGDEFGTFFLLNHGEVVAEFAHRRIRSISPYGGASTVRESVAMTEEMEDYSLRLLRAINWHGLAMVEFKQNKTTGQMNLMEINGRFWGSLPLAIYAGVDFPYLYYQLANNKIEKYDHYRIGIKSRHLLADTKLLFTVLAGRRKIKGLNYPGRYETLKNYFIFFEKNLFYDVESISDPLPLAMEIINTVTKLVK
jgi:predicted ATP-grasp superfamily ATP-dependent carboligase